MTRALKFKYGDCLYFTSGISQAERDQSSDEAPSISAYSPHNHWVEVRRYPRKNFRTSVDFSTQDRAYSDYIRDISVAGVFIETRSPLKVGEELILMIPFSDGGKAVRVKGVVVRKTRDGVGVEFKNLKRLL
ncbi:MAG: PilZ domain-containing protein [Thermodesulfobacteriota bacterium]